jgi:hypothetical protein
MKCPYCVEDVQDEAIVCPHCRRDLAFFSPVDNRLKAIETELNALTETVTKMATYLDHQQAGEDPGRPDGDKKSKKPTFWGKLFVAFLQLVLLIVLGVAILGLALDLSPTPGSSAVAKTNPAGGVAANGPSRISPEQEQIFERDLGRLLILLLGLISMLPIALGFWMGLRWRGRNLKHYLSLGLFCGLLDGAILSTLFILAMLDHHSPGDVTSFLLIIIIDLFRCVFGFATGGLLGDWVERRKHPQFYGKGFTEALETIRLERARGFDRITMGFGKLATSIAPLVPLLGVIITSIIGFYTAQSAAKRAALDRAEKTVSTPASSPSPSR